MAVTLRDFEAGARLLAAVLPDVLDGADRDAFDARALALVAAGVPAHLAHRVAALPSLLAVFDIVEVSRITDRSPETVMAIHFGVGSRLQLNWLRDRIIDLPRANRWQTLARSALRDDLFSLHRALTHDVLEAGGPNIDGEAAIQSWWHRNAAAVERCLGMIADVRASRSYDTTTLPVALREVRNLVRG